jgi:putative sigma-54 modulation protein
MKIIVQSLHFDADRKLLEMIQKKYEKLDSFFDRITQVEVILRINKSVNGENKMVEVKIFIPGNTLFAKLQCSTFEEAVDLSVDTLSGQLIRHKEKTQSQNYKSILKES